MNCSIPPYLTATAPSNKLPANFTTYSRPCQYPEKLIYNAPTTAASTPQPTFEISHANTTDPSTPLQHYRTRHFYRDLVTCRNTNLPAIPHWQATLQPPPTFNKEFWKNLYPPLASNKQGNLNWKIAHRILPTALSLHRMTVHPTSTCHNCGEVETIPHLLLHCQHLTHLWDTIQLYTDKITIHTVNLTDTV